MGTKKALLIASASLALVLATVTVLLACFSSTIPPTCAQTIYLAKFTPGNVVIPPGGAGFNTTVGVLPFVSWDNTNAASCAQPSFAEVALSATCTPIGGGAPFAIPTQTTTVATPTVPGQQPVPGGALPFAIPAGTPPSTCAITGTYSVTFGAGGAIGAGVRSGTGDTQVCLVEPSPVDPTLPRLDFHQIDLGDDLGVLKSHQGDQRNIYFLVANNDPVFTATINLESQGRQIAGLPDGFTDDETAFNNGVFRISNDDADVFPADFFFDDGPAPAGRVPGDPFSIPPPITTTITLGPNEIGGFGLATNNFGACADGSCNERFLDASAIFTDGSTSEVGHACAQFVHIVDNSQPVRFPGLTVQDDIKVHDEVDAFWGPLQFFEQGVLVDETHKGTVLPQNIPSQLGTPTAIQTSGEQLQQSFPNQAAPITTSTDLITVPHPPDALQYDVLLFDQRTDFIPERNTVVIINPGGLSGPCAVPSVQYMDFSTTNLIITLPEGCDPTSPVEIQIPGQPTLNMTLDDLKNNPPPNFMVDNESCRTISFPEGNNLDAEVVVADPPLLVENLRTNDPIQREVRILDVNLDPVDGGTASLTGPPGITLPNPNIVGGSLFIEIDPTAFDVGLDIGEGVLEVQVPGAINASPIAPLLVPIEIRRVEEAPIELVELNLVAVEPLVVDVGGTAAWNVSISGAGDLQGAGCLFKIDTMDPLDFTLPSGSPFSLDPLGPQTPSDEQDRLRGFFGDKGVDPCFSLSQRCAEIRFGDGPPPLGTDIFADGFESGDVSSWSATCNADNATGPVKEEGSLLVRDANGVVPVDTPQDLSNVIDALNDPDFTGDRKIGLNSDRFEINSPLPPIRGTYFFDEFESFRKTAPAVTFDGTNCPAPCSGMVIEGNDGRVSNIRFENFPDYGLEIRGDGYVVSRGAFAGNGQGGVRLEGNGNTVGGSLDEANTFDGNGGAGVVVAAGTGNRLTYNTFAGNGGLGIDLGGDGVTTNDAGDADTGANGLQNFPEIGNALVGNSTVIEGTMSGTPSSSFQVQFFASDACDVSGHGEGARFLGETVVATDAGGQGAFNVTVDSTAALGQYVTATATNEQTGDTSEFSACFEVVSGVATEGEALPKTYALAANYPNPFGPETRIRYAVPETGPVRLAVYDLLGREVVVLVDEAKPPGTYEVRFDARGLPSGTYFYRMEARGFVATRTLTVLK